ncbi:MAG TPA: hypothetical protein PLA68_04475, partial [Panacibacter sp.]|nr:hypothetical protein [Panacibacter sp.]
LLLFVVLSASIYASVKLIKDHKYKSATQRKLHSSYAVWLIKIKARSYEQGCILKSPFREI